MSGMKQIMRQKIYLKAFRIWLFAAFISIPAALPAVAQQAIQPELYGSIDSLTVEGNQLIVQGWAGSMVPSNKVTVLSIRLADTLVYEGPFEPVERRDVASATGREDWLASGWRILTPLPNNLTDMVRVEAQLANGSSSAFLLSGPVAPEGADKPWGVRITLITLFVLLCAVYFGADFLADWISRKTARTVAPSAIFGAALLLFFGALVGMGITGSSLNLGIQRTPFVQADMINVWGHDQFIRGDEFFIATPLAIAQYNHQPKFPVVNRNAGEDGQNMLVVGGAGLPARHISQLAKPATWGFFLFDLRRALSWLWCFPIFACLFSLWGVVALLRPGDWKAGFLISLWFSLSPYVVAWSYAPAYAVFFPCLALLAAITILKSHNKYLLPVWGCVLGLSATGFVLFLYPPWQVSLAYLFLALGIGLVIRDKLYKNFTRPRLGAYGIAILLAGFILWWWWSDARPAIEALSATVYPGQRVAATGGDISLPHLLRGFTDLITLHKTNMDPLQSSQSGVASFFHFFLPIVLLFIFRACQRVIGAVEIALAAMISFILCFMLVSIPVWAAKFSLWGRLPGEPADLALGLASMLLCSLLMLKQKPVPDKPVIRVAAFAVAAIWASIVLVNVSHLHKSIIFGFPPGVAGGLFMVIAVAGYWLALGKFRPFIGLMLALSAATVLPFNPVNIAPNSVTAVPYIRELKGKGVRILVLETQRPAMFLLASGLPVANGVFYYPQMSLWNRLDPDHTESNTYNRYQHLVFSGGVSGNANHCRILSTWDDSVRVIVDLEQFDFRQSGAQILTAPRQDEEALRKNAVLSCLGNDKGWSWFKINGVPEGQLRYDNAQWHQ